MMCLSTTFWHVQRIFDSILELLSINYAKCILPADFLWATVPRNMKPAAPSSAKTPEKKPKTKKEKSKAKAKVAKAAKADVEDPAAPRKSKKRKGE
jgi:hypothetical protein